jgi:hypothetical protein
MEEVADCNFEKLRKLKLEPSDTASNTENLLPNLLRDLFLIDTELPRVTRSMTLNALPYLPKLLNDSELPIPTKSRILALPEILEMPREATPTESEEPSLAICRMDKHDPMCK